MTTRTSRIPDPQQLSLELFSPLTFEDILERDHITALEIVYSRRLKTGWNIRVAPLRATRTLTIPAFMQNSPAAIKEALIEWALLPVRQRKFAASHTRRRELEQIILGHCTETGLIAHSRRRIDPAPLNGPCQGSFFDLREIFDKLNRRFFNNALESSLRWGAFGSTTSYQAHRTDTAGNTFNLITIAGVYDHPDVPRFAIEAVMYHEMCHIAVPPVVKNGRRNVHGRAFRLRERQYPAFTAWQEWERDGLMQIVRSMRREKRKKQR